MDTKKTVQIMFVVIIVIIMANIARTTFKTVESGKRVATLEAEIADLQQQSSRLRRVLADRNTNAFVEMVARNKLNYMKPGESLYVVVGHEDTVNEADMILQQFKTMTPWDQWRLLLFNAL